MANLSKASSFVNRQSHPFMFEPIDASGNPVVDSSFILPINPEQYRISYPTRSTLTQTRGGAFEDNAGMGLPKISLQGTFGLLGSYQGGVTIDGSKKTGWEIFKDVEQTFIAFYEAYGTYTMGGKPTTNMVDPARPTELRFYDLADRSNWVVQINRFDFQRSTQRRMLYIYDIQMTAIRRADASSQEFDVLQKWFASVPTPGSEELSKQVLGQVAESRAPEGFLTAAIGAYSKTYAALSDAVNYVQKIQQNIQTIKTAVVAFKQGLTDFIMAPFELVKSTIEAVDTVIGVVNDIANLPHEITKELRGIKRDMLALSLKPNLFRVSDTATGEVVAVETQASDVVEILTAEIPQTTDGSFVSMDTPETTLFATGMESAKAVAVRAESISDGDTIETIAEKTLGSAASWKAIADMNGLEYPFIVSHPRDAMTETITSGLVQDKIEAGSRTVSVSADTTMAPGSLFFIESKDGALSEYARIESVLDWPKIKLETPLVNGYDAGAKNSEHAGVRSVMMPGDKIGIPGDIGVLQGLATTDTSDDMYTALFGTDEALDESGRHYLDPDGTIGTKSGLDNIEMQFRHRLATLRGELAALGHPKYGSYMPMIIGKIGSTVWYERAAIEAQICLLEDPRVTKVDNVQLEAEGTAVYISADVHLIGQKNPERMNILFN